MEGEPQSSEKRHGWKPSLVTGMLCGMLRLRHVGIGIRDDFSVQELDGAGGVALGKLRVVGDHDDQPIPSDFLQKIHDLYAGFRIQRAGGFVCQKNFRVVDQGTGDGHPLHLAAGHLIGLFVDLIGESHLLKGGNGSAAALISGNTGKGQRQLHVGKDALVGDQVVALENKADGVVAVGVPVPIPERLGGDAADGEVAGGVLIQTADDVEQGCLAAAGMAENGHKFIFPEGNGEAAKRLYLAGALAVGFGDVGELQQMGVLLSCYGVRPLRRISSWILSCSRKRSCWLGHLRAARRLENPAARIKNSTACTSLSAIWHPCFSRSSRVC